ncbi:MAG: hypothetical protein R3E12_07980 [Candidatus Eisenbacteria bacterium]
MFAWITGQNTDVGTGDVDSVDLGQPVRRHRPFRVTTTSGSISTTSTDGAMPAMIRRATTSASISPTTEGLPSRSICSLIGDQTTPALWHNLQVDLEDQIPLTSTMMLRAQASDGTAQGDIIEAGLDDIRFLDRGDAAEPPTAPSLISPADGAQNQSSTSPTWSATRPIPRDSRSPTGSGSSPTRTRRTWSRPWKGAAGWAHYVVGRDAGAPDRDLPLARVRERRSGLRTVHAERLVPGRLLERCLGDWVRRRRRSHRLAQPGAGAVRIRYYTPRTPTSTCRLDAAGRLVRLFPGACWTEGWQRSPGTGAIATEILWLPAFTGCVSNRRPSLARSAS